MNIAVVAGSKHRSQPIIIRLEQMFSRRVDFFNSYTQAEILYTQKFDGIYLWPINVMPGQSNIPRSDNSLEFYGKRVLTDHIKKRYSINKQTPTVVIVGSDINPGYTRKDYEDAGADMTSLASSKVHRPFEFFEHEFRKKVV